METTTRSTGERRAPSDPLAQGLGWASLGLGVPMTTMPGPFVELLGIRPDAKTRALAIGVGIQECAAAAGILTQRRPVGWLWGRVAGDVLHLTMLGRSLYGRSEWPNRTIAAMGATGLIGVIDTIAALRTTQTSPPRTAEGAHRVMAAVTVRKPREQMYAFWHDFQNLPSFMGHLESVEYSGDGRSHWRAKAPVGTVEWDAEIVEDRPNQLISWRSVDGSSVRNTGTVRFVDAPGGRGTEIHVDLAYAIPAGTVGTTLAKVLGEEPTQQVKDDLRRFKQVVETGSLVRSDGSPEGQHAGRMLRQRPAQPLPEAIAPGRS